MIRYMTAVQKTCQTYPYVKNLFVYLHHIPHGVHRVGSFKESQQPPEESRHTTCPRQATCFFHIRIAVRHCTQQRLQFCCSWNTSAFATVYIINNILHIQYMYILLYVCVYVCMYMSMLCCVTYRNVMYCNVM